MGKSGRLQERTKQFALMIIRLYSVLPRSPEAQVIGKQLLRSGTSVGAQNREAQRGRSSAEFVSKLQGALQELDETQYWLELLQESGIVQPQSIHEVLQETNELIAMHIASVNTVKYGKKQSHEMDN